MDDVRQITPRVPTTEVTACRACGSSDLAPVLDLGTQALTGIFPRPGETVPTAPLEVVRCTGACGLVQLRHTADLHLMYGEHYGYRSGIRPFMVEHLRDKVRRVSEMVDLAPGDVVLDIGSNDGTLLHGYATPGLRRVGIDPTGVKWQEHYTDGLELVPDFFGRQAYEERCGAARAKVVTSVAMFYDLPDPVGFMAEVRDVLADDGVWLLEMSYLGAMLGVLAYDAVCHEHLEYYSLEQISWMAGQVGLTITSAELTDVNGGSLCLTLVKDPARHRVQADGIGAIRRSEAAMRLHEDRTWEDFAGQVARHREDLRTFLDTSRAAGLRTLGYGASTKGNVVLQYCGVTTEDLPCIGEVSPEKHGRVTPGTGIPIVSEEEAKAQDPDQLLVLPWVHRGGFVSRERDYVASGGRLVFPLPRVAAA